jgi:hypothetical protein
MMAKKLTISYGFSFDLIGLACAEKPYKLAWALNQALGIELKRDQDIVLEFVQGPTLRVLNFSHFTENNTLRLIKNKSHDLENVQLYLLVPELEHFDFFVWIDNQTGCMDLQEILGQLQTMPMVQYAQEIEVTSLKSKDNFIFY